MTKLLVNVVAGLLTARRFAVASLESPPISLEFDACSHAAEWTGSDARLIQHALVKSRLSYELTWGGEDDHWTQMQSESPMEGRHAHTPAGRSPNPAPKATVCSVSNA